jgi:hypothetical protein
VQRREKYYTWQRLREAGYTNEDVASILDVPPYEVRELVRIDRIEPHKREQWLTPVRYHWPQWHTWTLGAIVAIEVVRTCWSVYVANQ